MSCMKCVLLAFAVVGTLAADTSDQARDCGGACPADSEHNWQQPVGDPVMLQMADQEELQRHWQIHSAVVTDVTTLGQMRMTEGGISHSTATIIAQCAVSELLAEPADALNSEDDLKTLLHKRFLAQRDLTCSVLDSTSCVQELRSILEIVLDTFNPMAPTTLADVSSGEAEERPKELILQKYSNTSIGDALLAVRSRILNLKEQGLEGTEVLGLVVNVLTQNKTTDGLEKNIRMEEDECGVDATRRRVDDFKAVLKTSWQALAKCGDGASFAIDAAEGLKDIGMTLATSGVPRTTKSLRVLVHERLSMSMSATCATCLATTTDCGSVWINMAHETLQDVYNTTGGVFLNVGLSLGVRTFMKLYGIRRFDSDTPEQRNTLTTRYFTQLEERRQAKADKAVKTIADLQRDVEAIVGLKGIRKALVIRAVAEAAASVAHVGAA